MNCRCVCPEDRNSLLPSRVLETCIRREGHSGPHQSRTREWEKTWTRVSIARLLPAKMPKGLRP